MAIPNPALATLLKFRKQISFFDDMSPSEISELLFNIRFRKFAKGEVLFTQGDDKSKDIFYMLKGELALNVNKMRVATIDTPTLFGEMSNFTGEPRSATIIAGEGGAILISFLITDSIQGSEPMAFAKLYKNVVAELSKKIVEMNQKLLGR
jgi:CRP-like cAMP-binding protein